MVNFKPRPVGACFLLLVLVLNHLDFAWCALSYNDTITAVGTSVSQVVTGTVQGGSSQLYILVVAVRNDETVSSVSGLGLTWTQRKNQCSGRGQQGIKIWTAYGSPSNGAVTVNLGVTAAAVVVSVSRYSGADSVAPTEGHIGQNTIAANDTNCSTGTDDDTADITLTSSRDNSILFFATNARNKTISTADASYSQRATNQTGSAGDLTILYIHDRTMTSAGSDPATHTLSGASDWSTAGLAINPEGEDDDTFFLED